MTGPELLTATCRFCGEAFEHPRTDGISMLRINHEAKCQMNPKNTKKEVN